MCKIRPNLVSKMTNYQFPPGISRLTKWRSMKLYMYMYNSPNQVKLVKWPTTNFLISALVTLSHHNKQIGQDTKYDQAKYS